MFDIGKAFCQEQIFNNLAFIDTVFKEIAFQSAIFNGTAVQDILFQKIALSDLSIRVLQLLTVLLLDRFISLPAHYHPASLFKQLAWQLASRVNKRSPDHQRIAGQLSLLLLMSCALGIVWIILSFSVSPLFFESLLLWLVISSRSMLLQTLAIQRSLALGHKILAREQLQKISIRDTKNLSTIGIVKATIEVLPQQLVLTYFSPILIFACFGIYPTMFIVTLTTLAHSWNPKLAQFRYYGSDVMKLNNISSFVTKCLVAVNILLLFGNSISLTKLVQQAKQWHNLGSGLLLGTIATVLSKSLGGAVSYQSIKLRRAPIGEYPQPNLQNIDDIYRICRQLTNSWLLILLLILATSITINLIEK